MPKNHATKPSGTGPVRPIGTPPGSFGCRRYCDVGGEIAQLLVVEHVGTEHGHLARTRSHRGRRPATARRATSGGAARAVAQRTAGAGRAVARRAVGAEQLAAGRDVRAFEVDLGQRRTVRRASRRTRRARRSPGRRTQAACAGARRADRSAACDRSTVGSTRPPRPRSRATVPAPHRRRCHAFAVRTVTAHATGVVERRPSRHEIAVARRLRRGPSADRRQHATPVTTANTTATTRERRAAPSTCARSLQHVDRQEHRDPHHVHEVPVEGAHFERRVRRRTRDVRPMIAAETATMNSSPPMTWRPWKPVIR